MNNQGKKPLTEVRKGAWTMPHQGSAPVPDRVLVLQELLEQIDQVSQAGDPDGELASLQAEYRLLRGEL